MGNTVGTKSLYSSIKLNRVEKDILIGTILGDACIESCKRESRIQIAHSEKQKDYLIWKYSHLKRWTLSPPKHMSIKDKRNNKIYHRWRFRTFSHPEFSNYKELFYENERKIIPRNIKDILRSPLSLAVWYMDDGKRRPDCRGAYLDTICFSKEEQERLIKCLENNFRIRNTRLHWNGEGYHIYIPYTETQRLTYLIEKYVIPLMRYKLPLTRNDFIRPKRIR